MIEIWKDIKGYEGLYQVSNFGNVRRFYKNKKIKNIKPVLTPHGYYVVNLSKNQNARMWFVHKLVALAFLGESQLSVNHKDENKANNNLENLEYLSIADNVRYSNCKKVLQINKDTNEVIREWDGIADVERALKICNTNITQCCKGKRATAGGYKWRYAYGG